jgi:FAD:protein FMN transferase
MGCEIAVRGASPGGCRAIVELFAERERVFSRFVTDSELNRVNDAAGRPVRVSTAFASMLALALEAAEETDGLVDPTLGVTLERAGYDADFDVLSDDGVRPLAGARGDWRSVSLLGHLLVVPVGVRLDLNGVVKGKTVDDALTLLGGNGLVCAGGDLAVQGGAVVALPGGGSVQLVRGALATSGTDRRRWRRGGVEQHHLIDPQTGAPSRSPWLQVTACGATCTAADIAAKAAFLLGANGPAWLDSRHVPGRFVTSGGLVRTNKAWRRGLERERVCT